MVTKMKKNISSALALSFGILLFVNGCATDGGRVITNKWQPKWYTNAPVSDDEVLYTKGEVAADNPTGATQGAVAVARAELAETYQVYIRSQTGITNGEVSVVIASLAERALVGSRVVNKEHITVRTKQETTFYGYALVRLPLGEANQLLLEETKQERRKKQDARLEEAFDKLEDALEEDKRNRAN